MITFDAHVWFTTPKTSHKTPSTAGIQLLSNKAFTLAANIETFAAGCGVGWYSPALPVLQSPANSPLLDGAVSADMAGWIGSALAVGALCGCLFFGLLGNAIGYKRSMLLTSLPMIVRTATARGM